MFFSSLFCSAILASTSMTLDERARGVERAITWEVQEKENVVEITGTSHSEETKITSTPTYNFTAFSHKGPVANYTIECAKNVLSVKGINENGNSAVRSFNLKGEPWVQQFWYGLKPFLSSNKSEYKFSIINPEDFSLVRMIAYKQQVEPLNVGGKTYDAQFVKITLQGFKGMFWSGKAWYDTKDHTFLKYEANKGPKTPVITIERKKPL